MNLLEDLKPLEANISIMGASANFDIPVDMRSLVQVAHLEFHPASRRDIKIVGAASSVISTLAMAPSRLGAERRLELLFELRQQLHRLVSEISATEPDLIRHRFPNMGTANQEI